jgi:hypothetical protein
MTSTIKDPFSGDLRFSDATVLTRMRPTLSDSNEPYLSTREIAERFSLKPKTIREWHVRYADFPALKMPGFLRIRASDFVAWLERFSARKEGN